MVSAYCPELHALYIFPNSAAFEGFVSKRINMCYTKLVTQWRSYVVSVKYTGKPIL